MTQSERTDKLFSAGWDRFPTKAGPSALLGLGTIAQKWWRKILKGILRRNASVGKIEMLLMHAKKISD